ncbi:hypothetical protein GW17_00044595 [Ensete ventricosum]|nr:hypothetical protein GW17_00044595 [Ensete ventricosum]
MRSTERLGWLSSSYSSTLATKLDGAQGKAGRLVKDRTVQSGRCCVTTERVVQSSQRDRIMRRYDQELLGAPLWCTTQQEEGLWIQGVNVVVPQRWVFVCASKLALDESHSHQHMGVVYHRGRSPSASTRESHGGGRDHMNDQELLGAPLW